jgi:hypothetical protein
MGFHCSAAIREMPLKRLGDNLSGKFAANGDRGQRYRLAPLGKM